MLSPAAARVQAVAEAQSLNAFADSLFEYLPRPEQRRWARSYLRGLLATPGKKSMRRLAATLSTSATASYSLQQFINESPWEWSPARHVLADWIQQRAAVRAWTIIPVTLPKRGKCSVGVHRRFVSSVGRTVNCQVALTLLLSCPGANFPVDWQIFLPDQWTTDQELRQGARVPEKATQQQTWEHVSNLVCNISKNTSLPPAPIVADLSEAQDISGFVGELLQTPWDLIVAVNPRACVVTDDYLRIRRPRHVSHHGKGMMIANYLSSAMGSNVYTATSAEADGSFRRDRVFSSLLQLSTLGVSRVSGVLRLFAKLDVSGGLASPLWLTNLTDRRLDELLELTLCYASSTFTIDCMNQRFGLLDFSGRSFPGWHHHMTLASAAYAYMRLA